MSHGRELRALGTMHRIGGLTDSLYRHRVTIKKRHNLLPFQAGGAASTFPHPLMEHTGLQLTVCNREEDCGALLSHACRFDIFHIGIP